MTQFNDSRVTMSRRSFSHNALVSLTAIAGTISSEASAQTDGTRRLDATGCDQAGTARRASA
jgi:hypothetical protein